MGALAYDVIGNTDKVFDESGPGLNCKVTDQQEFFGGCAGNIAYGLNVLKTHYLLLSTAGGADFHRYANHLKPALDGILEIEGAHCAKANIITDPNGTQFTAFSPGPAIDPKTWSVHLQNQAFASLDLLVCAPFPALMMQAALRIAKTQNENILNIWVPGQYADGMSTTELTNAIRYCDVLIGNAHEIAYIRKMLPEGFGQKTVIETDGPRPVRAMLSDGSQRTLPIPAVSPIVDPTGCGDAFVAGIVPALLKARDEAADGEWETNMNDILRAGIEQAGRCLSHRGSQTYGYE